MEQPGCQKYSRSQWKVELGRQRLGESAISLANWCKGRIAGCRYLRASVPDVWPERRASGNQQQDWAYSF